MDTLGLHFDGPFTTCARLQRSTATVGHVKQLYKPGMRCASAQATTVRTVPLPDLPSKKILQGLPFQIEALSHVPLSELVYALQLRKHEALAFLARQEALQAHLESWQTLGLEPDVVTASAQALRAFARWRCPEFHTGFVVHLGWEQWTCVFLERGEIQRSFALDEGTGALVEALKTDAPSGNAEALHLLQLDARKFPTLAAALQRLREQLHTALGMLHTGAQPVLFTGKTDAFGFFRAGLLEGATSLSLYELTPPIKLEERQSAIAIGSALEAAEREPLQLLQGRWIPAKTWRRVGARAVALMAASLALTGGILAVGHWKAHATLDASSAPRVAAALRAAVEYKQESPYLVAVPPASEVLSWLTRHPLLAALQAAGDPLEIADFRYELTSFPQLGAMDVGYGAKVTLEFRVHLPTSARKFHDALLQDEQLIDTSQEIGWESFAEGYRTSFFLKQQVPHVL